jgi:hypothetical protein
MTISKSQINTLMSSSTYSPFKKPGTKSKYTEKEIKELAKCSIDPLYFMKNFVRVQHPLRGAVPLIPYNYQTEIINNIQNYKDNIILLGRQMGKTEAVASYILWYTLFNPDKTVLIVANKLKQAIEIMSRIRYSYQELPDYIRDSATEYNKSSIVFSNGSKIVCRATTPDAGRGLSISLLYADEFAFVRTTMAEAFWTSIQPVLSTGGKCIITSTPNNDEDIFAQIWRGAVNTIDEFGNINEVGSNGFKAFKAIWSGHPDRDEVWAASEKSKLGEEKFLREHCCEFISADDTLINPHALNRLRAMEPKYSLGTVRWYKDISPNKTYIASLDPSAGVGRDSATIQIFEMPSMEQVGEWMHNRTPPREQIRIMMNILKFIKSKVMTANLIDMEMEPNIFWSFENNSYGEAIISLILEIGEDKFPGTLINEPKVAGHVKNYRRGLHTTNRNKVLACTKLKTFIDSDRMKINSHGLIYQLKNFVSSGVGFSGKPGINDDLVMSAIVAIRIMLLTAEWGAFNPQVLKETLEDDEEPLMPIIVIN